MRGQRDIQTVDARAIFRIVSGVSAALPCQARARISTVV